MNFDLSGSPVAVLAFMTAMAASLPLASSLKDSSAVTLNTSSSGCLSQSFVEERSRLGPYKKEDVISQSHVCEATETLLARAQADLGQALPHHVDESLRFLQDSLFDVCQG